ncbi:MAG TPA: SCP2 sterol-binding domain-containing protein [Anaerolineae bacterium]|nr:SCP2 sterol-binding domain-containing protein [Anaerolineae bacterium]
MAKFPSDEWIKAMAQELNASEPYRKAAAKWEGDFYFIAEAGPGLSEPVHLYMDLWHGECREAGEVAAGEKAPEFTISAPVATWRRVIEKQLDPIRGMMTGQLKLKGTMSKIMRFPKAATELVNCATKVPTEFVG